MMSLSLACKKNSLSMNVTKQSLKYYKFANMVRQSPASRMPHGRSGSAQPPAASGLSVERRTPTCRLQLCSACSCSADGLEQPPAWLPPGPLQAAAPAAARGTPSPVGHGAPAGHGLGALALAAHRLTGRRRRRRAGAAPAPLHAAAAPHAAARHGRAARRHGSRRRPPHAARSPRRPPHVTPPHASSRRRAVLLCCGLGFAGLGGQGARRVGNWGKIANGLICGPIRPQVERKEGGE
uniref:Uncharacterized protein n=1 Tax=Oryza sativa subsp. japonica TaxID=39947 RepID=Q654S3_ORYSJ|nr:hypothetical protein [Oryza sativa Japonica Group]